MRDRLESHSTLFFVECGMKKARYRLVQLAGPTQTVTIWDREHDHLWSIRDAAGIDDDLYPSGASSFQVEGIARFHGAVEGVVDRAKRECIVPTTAAPRSRSFRS
jgi:hypothetical protein